MKYVVGNTYYAVSRKTVQVIKIPEREDIDRRGQKY